MPDPNDLTLDNADEAFKALGERLAELADDAVSEPIKEKTEELAAEVLGLQPLEVADSKRALSSFKAGLQAIKTTAQAQAEIAIRNFYTISEEIGEEGTRVLGEITSVGIQVADGSISVEDGEIAVDQYMETLQLLGHALRNEAAVQAFLRGQAITASIKSVVFSMIKMGINAGSSHAQGWIGGLNLVA